jgi:hypothetical protein
VTIELSSRYHATNRKTISVDPHKAVEYWSGSASRITPDFNPVETTELAPVDDKVLHSPASRHDPDIDAAKHRQITDLDYDTSATTTAIGRVESQLIDPTMVYHRGGRPFKLARIKGKNLRRFTDGLTPTTSG